MKKVLLSVLYFANLIAIVVFWYLLSSNLFVGSEKAAVMLAIGRLSGLLLVWCVLMQFMLIGRIKWIESVYGLDKLSRIHKWNGYTLTLFLILHPLFIVSSYALGNNFGWFKQLWYMVQNTEDILGAAVAVLLLIAIIVISITIVRKKLKYETWYVVHLFTYLAVLLAWGHQLQLGGDFQTSTAFTYYWYALYIFILGNFAWYRFLRPIINERRFKFTVSRIVKETYDTNSIYISGKNLEQFPIKPGQFAIFRFLSWPFILEAHPFSFSYITKNNELRLTPKGVGDFTKTLGNLKPGTPVFIDGPHGVFTSKKKTHAKTLLIAGGVGITPLRALAEQLSQQEKDIILLYGNKSSNDIIFGNELEAMPNVTIHHIMSNPEPGWNGLTGYIDKEKILKLVPDVNERDVFLCGPPVMMNLVNRTLLDIGLKPSQIHFEEFSL